MTAEEAAAAEETAAETTEVEAAADTSAESTVAEEAGAGQPANKTATQPFTLTVRAVNDVPTFTHSGNVTVDEDFATTENVTVTPAAVPLDESGQTVSYSILPTSVAFASVSIDRSL